MVAKKRISDGSAGFTVLTEMLAAAGDSFDDAIPIAIETPRGAAGGCAARDGAAGVR